MLLNNVGAFSRGLFSHEGPTEEQMSQASSPPKLRIPWFPSLLRSIILLAYNSIDSVVLCSVGNLAGCCGYALFNACATCCFLAVMLPSLRPLPM